MTPGQHPQCRYCINRTTGGCSDPTNCIHEAHAEIARLRELVKDAYCEGVLYRGDDANPWKQSEAREKLEAAK